MARELIYRLTDPGYTIYHRAALGGLAATIEAWQGKPPEGITARVEHNRVLLAWGNDLSDQEALQLILNASFRLTKEKLIELPGQAIRDDYLRLAVHNGLCMTFLQHTKMRPSEKLPRSLIFRNADDDSEVILTYKAVNSYAHQKAQGTGLLDGTFRKGANSGRFPEVAKIPQSSVPGAMKGIKELEASPEEAILLLYLIVGCAVFLLRPRTAREKYQACVVVPDVKDLLAFSRAIQKVATSGQGLERFTNTYLGRVVGGAEEAALRLLVDLQADNIGELRAVAGLQAIAMGRVAWDKNQTNRSSSIKLKVKYRELEVFRQAVKHLGKTRMLPTAKGDGYAVPVSPVPELVAANLAIGPHWAARFRELVREKKDFERVRQWQRGLNHMVQAATDQTDRMVIQAFHEAWKRKMGELGERARRDGIDFPRLVDVERERMRNAIIRAKTADTLTGWFLRFCSDATKGASLPTLRENGPCMREFIFNPRNIERFQNLLLFALVSYVSDDLK